MRWFAISLLPVALIVQDRLQTMPGHQQYERMAREIRDKIEWMSYSCLRALQISSARVLRSPHGGPRRDHQRAVSSARAPTRPRAGGRLIRRRRHAPEWRDRGRAAPRSEERRGGKEGRAVG